MLNLRSALTQERLTNTLTESSLMATEEKILQDIQNSPNFCDFVIDIVTGLGEYRRVLD
jgi:hypothetical protein